MGNIYNIHDMKLHTELFFNNFKIFRVPGGWIYTLTDCYGENPNCVFVPFNNEFQETN
jgi:hypothetical protein